MLSKVVPRAKAAEPGVAKVEPMVFPSVTRDMNGFGARAASPQENDEAGALREKVRQLEARLAAERREAFEAGRLEATKQARAELDAVVERLNASIAGIVAMRPDLRRRAERDAVRLSLLIAKRILHRELSVDAGALTAIARVAFDRLARSECYRITVHPQFAPAITAALPGQQVSRVHIEPDPTCPRGTLIIHSDEGTMDASIDTQLEEIHRGLTDRLGASG